MVVLRRVWQNSDACLLAQRERLRGVCRFALNKPARAAFAVLAMFNASSAAAQTVAPSQVTPGTLRPIPSHQEGAPVHPATEQSIVPSADLNVRVGHVIIEGAFEEMAQANAAIRAGIERKRLTVAQIFAAARVLEEAYAQAGYALARVTVPPQTLTDGGSLRLVVIDGFIENVDAVGVPENVRGAVLERVAGIAGRRHILNAEIERVLLIAGDLAGLRLKSTLKRGHQEGGTLLILEGQHRLVTGSLGLNNGMPSDLGVWAKAASISANSPLGSGEQFYASASLGGPIGNFSSRTSPMRLYGGGLVRPVGPNGWIVNPEYTRSLTNPYKEDSSIAQAGAFERFSFRTSYPLIRTRGRTLVTDGTLEHVYQVMEAPDFNTALSKDSYTVLRGGGVLEEPLPWGASVRVAAHISRGLGGRGLAEAEASNIPLSRQDAAPVFTKFNAEIRLTHPLPGAVWLDMVGRGQSSAGEALLRPEQFALDGAEAVTSRPDYPFIVDEGLTLRAEVSRTFLVDTDTAPLKLVPYGFGACGWGRLDAPTAVEMATQRLMAAGVGIRGTGDAADGDLGALFALELAHVQSDTQSASNGWRVQFNSGVRF